MNNVSFLPESFTNIPRVRKILFVQAGALGDFILTLPAIRMLQSFFPEAVLEGLAVPQFLELIKDDLHQIHSIDSARFSPLFIENHPALNQLIPFFQNYDLICSWISAPVSQNLAVLASEKIIQFTKPSTAQRLHCSRLYLDTLTRHGIDATFSFPLLAPLQNRTFSKNHLPFRIAIHPGSGSPQKNWPLSNFCDLIEILLKNSLVHVSMILGPAEKQWIELLQTRFSLYKNFDIIKTISLTELVNRLCWSNLYLGNDSGVSHLAAALGLRTFVIFGPTDPVVWAPFSPLTTILTERPETKSGNLSNISVAHVLGHLGLFQKKTDPSSRFIQNRIIDTGSFRQKIELPK